MHQKILKLSKSTHKVFFFGRKRSTYMFVQDWEKGVKWRAFSCGDGAFHFYHPTFPARDVARQEVKCRANLLLINKCTYRTKRSSSSSNENRAHTQKKFCRGKLHNVERDEFSEGKFLPILSLFFPFPKPLRLCNTFNT